MKFVNFLTNIWLNSNLVLFQLITDLSRCQLYHHDQPRLISNSSLNNFLIFFCLLQIFKELMEKFNQLLNGIYFLRDFIPLNLFMLDNRLVNRVLERLVCELKYFVTNYFVTLNLVENRRMCDEFEEMSINSGERPKETFEVVTLQNYLVVCREEKLFRLRNELQHVKERVMFLHTYSLLTRKKSHKFFSSQTWF